MCDPEKAMTQLRGQEADKLNLEETLRVLREGLDENCGWKKDLSEAQIRNLDKLMTHLFASYEKFIEKYLSKVPITTLHYIDEARSILNAEFLRAIKDYDPKKVSSFTYYLGIRLKYRVDTFILRYAYYFVLPRDHNKNMAYFRANLEKIERFFYTAKENRISKAKRAVVTIGPEILSYLLYKRGELGSEPDAIVEELARREAIESILANLEPKYSGYLRLKFGIGDDEATLEEIDAHITSHTRSYRKPLSQESSPGSRNTLRSRFDSKARAKLLEELQKMGLTKIDV